MLPLFLIQTSLFAGTIEWRTVTITPDPYGIGDCLINLETQYGRTFVMCTISAQNPISITLSAIGAQLWPGMRWLEMQYGDWVNTETTRSGLSNYFFRMDPDIEGGSVTIGRGEANSVYLGFVILDAFGFDYSEGCPDTMFGWVQLGYDGKTISVLNSAIDISGDPIRIWIVPEPSCALLALSGIALLLLRRRKVQTSFRKEMIR